MGDIHWLDEESFAKARGQWRLQALEILSTFKARVLENPKNGECIIGALEELEEISMDLSKRTRGEANQPIRVKKKRNSRR